MAEMDHSRTGKWPETAKSWAQNGPKMARECLSRSREMDQKMGPKCLSGGSRNPEIRAGNGPSVARNGSKTGLGRPKTGQILGPGEDPGWPENGQQPPFWRQNMGQKWPQNAPLETAEMGILSLKTAVSMGL